MSIKSNKKLMTCLLIFYSLNFFECGFNNYLGHAFFKKVCFTSKKV